MTAQPNKSITPLTFFKKKHRLMTPVNYLAKFIYNLLHNTK